MTPSSDSGAWRKAWAVFVKDITSEFRTRYALSAVLLFAVAALEEVSYSVSTNSMEPDAQTAYHRTGRFFSAMTGLARSFVREEESRTVLALRLSAAPDDVYLGKLMFNAALQGAVALVVVPLFLVLMDITPVAPGVLAASAALGTLALAASSTIVAAIVSKAKSKGALFAVLAFPISVPGLASAVRSTTVALRGAGGAGTAVAVGVAGAAARTTGVAVARSASAMAAARGDLLALTAYSVLMIAASLLLFDFVWNE